jgi:hypothetical protein
MQHDGHFRLYLLQDGGTGGYDQQDIENNGDGKVF